MRMRCWWVHIQICEQVIRDKSIIYIYDWSLISVKILNINNPSCNFDPNRCKWVLTYFHIIACIYKSVNWIHLEFAQIKVKTKVIVSKNKKTKYIFFLWEISALKFLNPFLWDILYLGLQKLAERWSLF